MDKLQQKIGYQFKNPALIREALTLAHGNKAAAYERLEFLGDRVLGLVIADLLLKHHPKEKEGDIAKRFTALVREETLAELSRHLDLAASLITDAPELRKNNSVLADVMEALIAALYKDAGLEKVYAFLEPLYIPLLDKDIKPPVDPKTALQEWGHKHKILLPVYTVLSQNGPAHAPLFKVSVKMGGYDEVVAQGASKKIAEQNAAAEFLKLHDKDYNDGK